VWARGFVSCALRNYYVVLERLPRSPESFQLHLIDGSLLKRITEVLLQELSVYLPSYVPVDRKVCGCGGASAASGSPPSVLIA
jgi:hypothetical protein